MKLITPNNHIVLLTEDSLYLLDTGSPFSGRFDGKDIVLYEKSYKTNPILQATLSPDAVTKLTGIKVDGLIGMDVLTDTNGFIVDYDNQSISLDIHRQSDKSLPSVDITLQNLFGSQYVSADGLSLNGVPMQGKVVIDTGAYISYIHPRYLSEGRKTDSFFSDYNPILGNINGYFYTGTLGTTNGTLCADSLFAKIPEQCASLFDGIIGIDKISTHYIELNLQDGKIYYR